MRRHLVFMGEIFLFNDIKEKIKEFIITIVFSIAIFLFIITMISILDSRLDIAFPTLIIFLMFVGLHYGLNKLFK